MTNLNNSKVCVRDSGGTPGLGRGKANSPAAPTVGADTPKLSWMKFRLCVHVILSGKADIFL